MRTRGGTPGYDQGLIVSWGDALFFCLFVFFLFFFFLVVLLFCARFSLASTDKAAIARYTYLYKNKEMTCIEIYHPSDPHDASECGNIGLHCTCRWLFYFY